VNKDKEQHGNILTYDLVQCDGFQTVNSLPEDGQVSPKHVAINMILMLFLIKERLRTVTLKT
jgi:hypothetical protein